MKPDGDGFAMVTALLAAALFAYAALLFLQAERGGAVINEARSSRVRLAAAADAGLALAIHGLAMSDPARRWPVEAAPRRLEFDGIALTLWVEDERGKVPINQPPAGAVRRLLAAVGVATTELDSLSDAVLDWRDGDTAPRPWGAERGEYRQRGAEVLPRDEAIRSLDELGQVRGMSEELLARLRPHLTLYPGGRFDAAVASPQAVAAMTAEEGRVERTNAAWETVDPDDLRGRILTIRVEAGDGAGAMASRHAIVEYTGNPVQPVWLREYR